VLCGGGGGDRAGTVDIMVLGLRDKVPHPPAAVIIGC
jgi:hypothetical protein